MKQYLLRMPLLLLFAALAVDASAARQTPTTGRVVDPDGTAVAYATVVLLDRSEEHTSELQSLREISYAVFCLKKKK